MYQWDKKRGNINSEELSICWLPLHLTGLYLVWLSTSLNYILTVYSVEYTLYTVHCTVYSVHGKYTYITVKMVNCTMYAV